MRKTLSVALVTILALTGGCDDSLGPDSNEEGAYALASINGRSLPTPFFSVEVLSGSIELNPDRSYRAESTVRGRDSLGQLVTQTDSELGTYLRTENTLRFTSTEGHEMIASYGGRTITVREDTIVIVYRRESSR